jgi:hypothetical protein
MSEDRVPDSYAEGRRAMVDVFGANAEIEPSMKVADAPSAASRLGDDCACAGCTDVSECS